MNNNANEFLLQELAKRKPKWSLPQALYTDEDIFKADLENLFYSEWLFIGHDCELTEIGDYFRYEIGEYDIIILRDNDNQISAFHNTCRHRGSRLCTDNKGQKPQLVCPYHQWTYDLSGQLKYAKDMGGEFNSDFKLEDHKLHRVNCETVEGTIYICLSDDAPDFKQFKADVTPYLKSHNLQDAKVVYETDTIENGNWKLVFENNRECYHCTASHPELCRTFTDDPRAYVIPEKGDPLEEVFIKFWNTCDKLDLKSRYLACDESQYRVTRIPLSNDAESFTMDGKVASEKLMVEGGEKNLGDLLFFYYPNTWQHYLSDHTLSFRLTPINATETRLTTKWLVHKDAVEGKDYDLDNLTKVWIATNDEDKRLVEENQLGIKSPKYLPGPYSEFHEAGTIEFVDWYQRFSERKATAALTEKPSINEHIIKQIPEKPLSSESLFDVEALEQEFEFFDVDESITAKLSFTESNQEIISNQKTSVLESARKLDVTIPSACEGGICGTCKVMKKSGDVRMMDNGGISESEIDAGYILACCSYPLNDVEIEF